MTNIAIVLENSSKTKFGGGQNITLQVMDILIQFFEVILIDCANDTIFFHKAADKKCQRYSLNWSGKIIGGHKSSFMIGWKEICLSPFFIFRSFFRLRKILKTNNCSIENTIFYACTKKMLILAYIYEIIFGYKYVFHAHTLDDKTSFFFKLIKLLLKKAERIVCVSKIVAENISLPQCQVIYNSVDFNKRPVVSYSKKRKIIATFSTLIPLKGIKVFIDSFKYLKNYEGTEYWIFGDGPERPLLEKKAEGNIVFKGFCFDVIEEMQKNIYLVVVPSISEEACPVVPIEAFSLGIPVISTNIGGQAEIVKHDYVGRQVPVGNSEAIACEIDYLIDNPDIYFKLSNNTRIYAREVFNKKIFENKIKILFDFAK